jgi:ketosteroid isomerase-like protein
MCEWTRALSCRLFAARGDAMTDRAEIDHLLRALYAARMRGDLDAVCGVFANDAVFQVAGAGQSNPIANTAVGVGEFRPLLGSMIKAFKLSDLTILSILIDGGKAAVHWRAKVHSRISGTTVLTELIALVEVRAGRIVSYTEFFVPRA